MNRWQLNVQARAKWAEFLASPEFEEGLQVIRANSKAVAFIGESAEAASQRQYYQAGYENCIDTFEVVPDLHFKKHQNKHTEWGNLEEEQNESN